jgi:hypothetical protein
MFISFGIVLLQLPISSHEEEFAGYIAFNRLRDGRTGNPHIRIQ